MAAMLLRMRRTDQASLASRDRRPPDAPRLAPPGGSTRTPSTAARRAPVTHDKGNVWQVLSPLDLEAMRAGAAHLIGNHDFTTFRSTFCQAKSPQKTLDEISITEIPYAGGVEYRFLLRARSFLHNQVRSIIGTLERVGMGHWQPDAVKSALEARSRAACGPVCPPQGLYLAVVRYPVDPFAA